MSQKPNLRVENLEKAALRGEPSHVWRFGQNRRLDMIVSLLPIDTRRILVDGCGIGQYVRHLAELGYNTIGLDIDFDRVREGTREGIEQLHAAAGEHLPYLDSTFDALLSHEVIEHVADDRLAAHEMIRVLRPGGRVILFCPNRWYPFETHGHYWRGQYHFGNTPLINYLPNLLRNKFAPHVRAYTGAGIRGLFDGLPVRDDQAHADLSRLRQPRETPPDDGQGFTHRDVHLRTHAAEEAGPVAFSGGGKGRSIGH